MRTVPAMKCPVCRQCPMSAPGHCPYGGPFVGYQERKP